MSNRALIETTIKEAAIDLDVGETTKSVCPFCTASHEESFSITRIDEGIVYNCFRATCASKGFISSHIGTVYKSKQKSKKTFTPHPFEKSLEPLPEYIVQLLFKKYELTEEELHEQRIRYFRDEHRLFLPCYDSRSDDFGGITKTLTEGVRRFKTINYFNRETSRLHYPLTRISRKPAIAVAEDILSSIKVSRHVACVAALGHYLTLEQIKELRSQTDTLIIMLDNDVFHKAVKLRKDYGFYFRNFHVILLSKDPKDTPDEELKEIISETINT